MKRYLIKTLSEDAKDEISFIDIIKFFLVNLKLILSFALFGFVSSALYITLLPVEFEATAQIKLAEIAPTTNLDTTRIFIEDSQAFLHRMSLPGSYDNEIIKSCGLSAKNNATAELMRKVQFTVAKNADGKVNLQIRNISKDVALACTKAIVELVIRTQREIVDIHNEEIRKKIALENLRLKRVSEIIAKAGTQSDYLAAGYIIMVAELRYQIDQISALQNRLVFNEMHNTRLTTPIYLNQDAVSPPKFKILFLGSLFGAILGFTFALIRILRPLE